MKVRFRVAAEQVRAQNTVKLEVVVPHGAWPGQQITVQAPNGEHIQVQVPVGASGGLSIQFDVDARYGRPPERVTMRVTLPPVRLRSSLPLSARALVDMLPFEPVREEVYASCCAALQANCVLLCCDVLPYADLIVWQGCVPGQLLTVAKPNGEHVQVQVPNGAMPGTTIQFQV